MTHFAYSKKEEGARLEPDPDKICARHMELVTELSPMPKWSSVLILKEDMCGPYEYSDEYWESYPAVSLFLDFEPV